MKSVQPRCKKISGILSAFLAAFFTFAHSGLVFAKPILFRNAYETQFPTGPQGHLMDLDGGWSLAGSLNYDPKSHSAGYHAYGVLPLSQNPDRVLHGFYIMPAIFRSAGEGRGTLNYLGASGWGVSAGRGNINFPRSTFRGFLQLGYRQVRPNMSDSQTNDVLDSLGVTSASEERKSLLFVMGTSSTQTSLVSQKRPTIDSELLLTLRYDYEKGDFFSWIKASAFYPTLIDIGAIAAWYKTYNEKLADKSDNVTDAFFLGPRLRSRAWNHIALDTSVQWPLYRSFSGVSLFDAPRFDASVIVNF